MIKEKETKTMTKNQKRRNAAHKANNARKFDVVEMRNGFGDPNAPIIYSVLVDIKGNKYEANPRIIAMDESIAWDSMVGASRRIGVKGDIEYSMAMAVKMLKSRPTTIMTIHDVVDPDAVGISDCFYIFSSNKNIIKDIIIKNNSEQLRNISKNTKFVA